MPQRAFVKEFKGYTKWERAVENMITEDGAPVESFFVEKQMRILVDALLSSWRPQQFEDAPDEPRPFIAAANVGIFKSPYEPAIVPDMFLSLDVEQAADDDAKESHSYCLWVHGKEPEVVVEIISDKRGNEFGEKMNRYGRMNVRYYVTFDPREVYDKPFVRVYEQTIGWRYRLREDLAMPDINLGLMLWSGEYQGMNEEWLRWCDSNGELIPTGEERAQREAERAERETERANTEADARLRAEAEVQQLKAELARLRSESVN